MTIDSVVANGMGCRFFFKFVKVGEKWINFNVYYTQINAFPWFLTSVLAMRYPPFGSILLMDHFPFPTVEHCEHRLMYDDMHLKPNWCLAGLGMVMSSSRKCICLFCTWIVLECKDSSLKETSKNRVPVWTGKCWSPATHLAAGFGRSPFHRYLTAGLGGKWNQLVFFCRVGKGFVFFSAWKGLEGLKHLQFGNPCFLLMFCVSVSWYFCSPFYGFFIGWDLLQGSIKRGLARNPGCFFSQHHVFCFFAKNRC